MGTPRLLPLVSVHLRFLVHEATGRCGICGEPHAAHSKRSIVVPCERCGAPLHDTCYWPVVPVRERVVGMVGMEAEVLGAPFLCPRCRS